MATLHAIANGNISVATTWAVGNATSELDSEAGTTTVSTTNLDSATFTPGAIVVDGVALKIASIPASPSGTFTVTLRNSTGAVDVTSVTINVTDLTGISTSNAPNGWVFFKFASPQTLLAATAYLIRVVCSVASQVVLYRDATANNHARSLRTTTTQAVASGDKLLICGELTGAGTSNTRTVTMDYVVSTIAPGTITIGMKGILSFGSAASTNYYLRINGGTTGGATRGLEICAGGTFNIGTVSTPIPSTSTAVLEFNCATNVAFGMEARAGSTVNMYGASRTTLYTTLSSAAASAQAVLTVASTTGWVAGDTLAIAGTRSYNDFESRVILSVDSGTQVTLTANLTNTHDGGVNANGYSISAHVGNLTRNVKVRGISTTLQSYISLNLTATFSAQYIEFYQLGSGTGSKRGIDTTIGAGGSLNIQYCALHDFISGNSMGVYFNSSAVDNSVLSNNILYNINNVGVQISSSSTVMTFDNNLIIGAGSTGFYIMNTASTYTNNVISGGFSIGFDIEINNNFGTFSGNLVYGKNIGTQPGFAISVAGVSSVPPIATFTNCTAWRCGIGFYVSVADWIINYNNCKAFGNGTSNFRITGPNIINMSNCVLDVETGFGGTTIELVGQSIASITIDNCLLACSGSGRIFYPVVTMGKILARNCQINPIGGDILNQTTLNGDYGMIAIQRYNQITGNHRTLKGCGTLSSDAVFYATAGPLSLRMTPIQGLGFKLTSMGYNGGTFCPVKNGQTVTASVKIRKSVASSTTAVYNGNQPRLIQKANPAIGVNTDVVLATADDTANGAFITYSGTTAAATDDGVAEFIVDCDGNTGFINVDDWSFVTSSPPAKPWFDGELFLSNAPGALVNPLRLQYTSSVRSGLSSSPLTITYANNVLNGSGLVIGIAASVSVISAVSDNLNGPWTYIGRANNAGKVAELWYLPKSIAGTCTITISLSGSALVAAGMIEYSTNGNGLLLDQFNSNTGSSITPNSGAVTITTDGEVYVGVLNYVNFVSTLYPVWADVITSVGGASFQGISVETLGDGTNQPAGTYTAIWTPSSTSVWSAAVASLKQAAVSPPSSAGIIVNPGMGEWQ